MVYTWKALLSPSKPTYPAEMIHTAWGITSTRPYLRATNTWPQWTPAENMSEAVESISTSADNLLPLAHILHWQRRKEETEERYASLDFKKTSTCGVLMLTCTWPCSSGTYLCCSCISLWSSDIHCWSRRAQSSSLSASTTKASKAPWVSVHHLFNLTYNYLKQI